MKFDFRHQTAVHNPRHRLPDHFDQSNAVEVYVPFQDHNGILLGALFREVTLEEGGLDQPKNFLPVGGFG